MPIYEYLCNSCGHQFEEWQKITDGPVRKCPSCGKNKVERIVSLSAFHLKGSGWYVTDYSGKNSSTNKASNSNSSTETSTSPKAEATASTKCKTSCDAKASS